MGSGGERERHAEDQYCPSKRTRCNHRCGYFPVIAFATSITRALLLSQMDAGNAFVPVRSLASQSIDSVHLKVVNPIPRITVHIYAMINLPPLIISYVHVFCNSTIAWRTRGTRSVHGIGQNCEFDSWELYFEGRLFVRDDDYRLFQVDGKGFSSSSSLNVFGRIKRNCRGDEIYIYVLKRRKTRKGEVWNLNGGSKKRGPSSISVERLRVALFIEGMIWTKNITKQNSLSADSRNGGVQKHFTILVIYETNLVTLQFVFHSFLSLSSYFSSLNKLLWSKGKREKNWNWIPVK